jgi:signal peptidase I
LEHFYIKSDADPDNDEGARLYFNIKELPSNQGSLMVKIIIISSSSMRPNLNIRDAVIVIKVKPEEIKIGDIISYDKSYSLMSSNIITHRVIEVNKNGEFYIFKKRRYK